MKNTTSYSGSQVLESLSHHEVENWNNGVIFDQEEQCRLPLVVLSGEDVCSEQPVKQHNVHGGDETQTNCPHHQDVARHTFTVSCQPAGHPTRRTDTKHQ